MSSVASGSSKAASSSKASSSKASSSKDEDGAPAPQSHRERRKNSSSSSSSKPNGGPRAPKKPAAPKGKGKGKEPATKEKEPAADDLVDAGADADAETSDSPKNQDDEDNPMALATTTTTTAPSVGSSSSTDPQWQPVGRIRKTRKKQILHDLPPLQIGPADAPNSHPTLPSAMNADMTQEEYNAHLQERIQKQSRGATAPIAMARGVRKNELVARFENERTDIFKAPWRKYPEVPTTAELLREIVHLPTNIINEAFSTVDEYLETHYELLREDAFSGLREAVAFMQKAPDSDDTQEFAIYESVRVLGLTFATTGVCVKVSFSINRAGKRIRWEQSKRLIPGTLVCVSGDNFNTVKVATVAARPMEGLDLNPPEIDLLFNENEIELDTDRELVMVESRNGYFEAYKWTLRALQRMTIDNFPLHEHLCFLDQNVPPPKYIQKQPIFDLSSIFPDNPDKEMLENVDILRDWPKADTVQTSMDESQMTGLHSILTKRLGILQGPPGTGKTFVSANALQILLENMREGDPPIVVACQTNHALDQLLGHVLKFESEFIRLGGRTADKDKIKERTMYEMRLRTTVNIQGTNHGASGAQMRKLRDQIKKLLEPLQQELLTHDDFYSYGLISASQAKSFTSRAAGWIITEDDDERPGGYMGQWLGEYFVQIQTHEQVENEYEEGDIEYERLKEMEAEFHSGGAPDEIDGKLKGEFFPMGRVYTVTEPVGVSLQEVQQALRETKNMWELEEYTRAAIYHHLRRKVIELTLKKVKDLNAQYMKKAQDHRIARLEKDAYILAGTKLIGMTTTGLSKYRSVVAAVKPKVVLIEEAAEALEGPVIVACMPSVEHLVLVGDHQQLRGHCAVQDLEGDPYYLDISMFERLVTNDLPFVTLRTQRRMRPEIRELLEPIYHDKLVDHASVLGRESIQGMGDINVFWYSHAYEETTDEVHSRINVLEAQMVVHFADYLVLNGMDPKLITILTFYAGQRTQIRRTIMKNTNLGHASLRVATVDSYQGEENEVILLSLVRSNTWNTIGFLSNQNRVCVAMSRAKRGFYVFGNAKMTTTADKLWWEIGKIMNEPPSRIGIALPLTCQRHKSKTLIEDVLDWIDINGGCRKWCREILPCRHTCTLRCHAFEHKEIRCISKCTKFLACGHQCVDRLCWEECNCPKCGRGQKATEGTPATGNQAAATITATTTATTAQVVARSAAGAETGGRTRVIQEAPTATPSPPSSQRQFEGQLTAQPQQPPTPRLVEVDVDEWEAALPGNNLQQPVVTDREQFPDMPVPVRGPPPGPPNNHNQNGPPPTHYPPGHYYDDNNYNPNPGGPSMPMRGGGVYNTPRRQIKDRWPDEDENGQVIDDRDIRGYGQGGNRGGYSQQGARGDYGPMDDRGGYSHQGGRGDYGQRDDRGGYGPQGNRGDYGGGGYSQREDRRGYSQGNGGEYGQRDDRGGYSQQGSRGDYGQHGNRGEYGQQNSRGDYGQQGSRGDYGQQGSRGGYGQQSNGEYSQQGSRRGYDQQGNGEYNQRDDRGGYGQQGGRGEYGQQRNRGDYGQQGNRGSYSQQASRGGYPTQDPRANESWPALGGSPKNAGRDGPDPRQMGPWNGNNGQNRGPPGSGQTWGRGSGGGSPWAGRGRNFNRAINSYTSYR